MLTNQQANKLTKFLKANNLQAQFTTSQVKQFYNQQILKGFAHKDIVQSLLSTIYIL